MCYHVLPNSISYKNDIVNSSIIIMRRRRTENNDNRYSAFLPPANATSSRKSSSNSTNQNAHYQYYDTRLRTQQQTQQTLLEYQYSSRSPNRIRPSLYGSAHYQPPSFLGELSPSSADSISDLGEPISIFDDIIPLEPRRSIVAPSLSSSYVPPDPTRRSSMNDVRLATANALREQLITDIERSITDIDREITSLERRPSGPRYLPPRFSPIVEVDAQDDNHLRRTTIKPISLPAKKPIPIITSPVQKQIQQTSAHSTATTTKERNIGSSQNWPNKPKRIYEVIPSLPSDSKKTSRQSSVGGQNEHIKISEIQSPQTPEKSMEKQMSMSSIQFRGQYHYGPEMEEVEILSSDPENIDHQSPCTEIKPGTLYETLNTNQFLRDSSASAKDRALIFVPEFGGHSQTGFHEATEDLIHNHQHNTSMARPSTATSLHELTSTKDLNIQDNESLIQTAPEERVEDEITPRATSRNTLMSEQLYDKTETDLTNENDQMSSDMIKQSRPPTKTPITPDDLLEKTLPFQTAVTHSTAMTPVSPSAPPTDKNVSGLVAYFFSDFGNDGEGEEDVLSIDQNNFSVPTGAEIIADDDRSSNIMGPSQASLLILHSAHVPRQQQQLTSKMPLSIEKNNEPIKIEEGEEEIVRRKIDAAKQHISTATSILPSSSPPPKQVLPTSIIDDMQTQFSRNNNASNSDHYRQTSTTPLNMNIADSNIKDDEKRSTNPRIHHRSSSLSKQSRAESHIQSTKSGRNEEQLEKNDEETSSMLSRTPTPLKNIDNKRSQTPERIDSADQRIKSSSRILSRAQSMTSNHTKKDERTTPIDSPTKTSFKNIDRENSISRTSIYRPLPSASGERSEQASRTSVSRELRSADGERSEQASRTSVSRELTSASGERSEQASRRAISRQLPSAPGERFEQASRGSISRELPSASGERSERASRRSISREQPYASSEPSQPVSRASLSRPQSIDPSEEYPSSQQRSPSLRPSSRNQDIDQSFDVLHHDPLHNSTEDLQKTPTNENEPKAFTAESEHFLRNQSQTSPYDFNRRVPSGYSISHPHDSHRTSIAGSPLPVTLDSPEIDIDQPSTSRTATPMRKTSISSIDLPPDPNTLLTTTDEPDPDDPRIIKSTIHFQMLSSQPPPHTEAFVPDRNEPSPLENIVPLQKFPSRVQSAELPSALLSTEEPFHRSSSIGQYSPTNEMEFELNDESPPGTSESDVRIPSASRSNQEQEEPSHQTPLPSKHSHQQKSSGQSPSLPYPARLEDLMGPTPSPFHSTGEHKHEQQNQTNRLSSVSPPINPTENHLHHHSIQQNIPSKREHSDILSPSSTPRRSVLSNTNHTSVEGDDAYQQQIDTRSISPQNELAVSPDHDEHFNNKNNTDSLNDMNDYYRTPQQTLKPSTIEPTFITEHQRRPLSEKSILSARSDHKQEDEGSLYRNDIQLNSASIIPPKHHFSPPSSPTRSTSDEREMPTMTASQQHSKLSLRLIQQEPKRKKSNINGQLPPFTSSSPLPQIDSADVALINNDENLLEENIKQRRQRRKVSFSSSIAHFQREVRPMYTNWRERVAAILTSKHRPNEKYAHIQSRVNSFANFEYQPKKIKILTKKKSPRKTDEQSTMEENKFLKRKKFKVKKPKTRQETQVEGQTEEEESQIQSPKGMAPQLFGRLWCLPDGSPAVFHESLEWNAPSKLGGYSYENFNYEPQRNEFKIFNRKPRWHSESKLSELLKESPRFFHQQNLAPATSLPIIPDRDEPYFYQPPARQELGTERKIFDIQTNTQQQSKARILTDDLSHDSIPSDVPIFDEKLAWTGRSKLKDTTWQNINYQPKKSKVQIFHKTVHWNSEPKIRTRSPSTVHPSRASMSNVHIFDQKLNWDAQAKVHCWSEIDLRQLTRKKSIFAQYHDPKWNDVVTARVDATNYQYPRLPNNVEIFSDRLSWTRNSGLKNYVWENFDYKTNRRTRQANNQRELRETDQSPPNRPKWNAVSKTRSLNSVYNPKLTNSNMIRRGWDKDLRRKRVHKLPPLKRKRDHEDIPHLAIDGPPISGQLAIDYSYDHTSTIQGHTTSNGYATTSSRRSSKALVPLNHHPLFSELELPMDTPRSQRPVQQEWYNEMNKSRLTQRTDMGRTTNRSYRNSIDSNHQANTPRELATFRSSTRNSQNSVMSGTLLDSTIRTNRTTEFRLSKDMDEHHHHSHNPSQSMPIEIRGFKLEGTQLSVPDHATIRPLSNVSYGASERVKSRRVYPWSSLHPHGTSSRNSSLVPIAEFRRPSLDTTITESQALLPEE